MRKTTFKALVRDNSRNFVRFEATGYAFQVEGLALVLHRPIRDNLNGGTEQGPKYWTVTEPISGLSFACGIHDKRTQAIKKAEKVVADVGIEKIKSLILEATQREKV